MSKKNKKEDLSSENTIARNRKAWHDFTFEQRFEAGIVLQGWEVKSLRSGKVQITEGYVVIRRGEAWLLGSHITPILSISSHVTPDPTRTRKLLLHAKELNTLLGQIQKKGYTLIPLSLYWKKNKVKLEIGLAKGKAKQDKRLAEKESEWKREKQRLHKKSFRLNN